MDVQILMDDFNFYRSHTHHFQKLMQERPYLKVPTLNRGRRRLFDEMVAWCRANELEPRFWLFCMFQRGRWLFAPRWLAGYLMGDKALAWYRARRSRGFDDRLYRERIEQTREIEQQRAGTSVVYDPNVHVSAEVEARKRRLQQRGDPEGCLSGVLDVDHPTLGWHPRSTVCCGCSVAERCREALRGRYRFDIVALREGKITVEQARLSAVQHGPA